LSLTANSKNQITFDFLKLPSKKLYPDYYESIESPISLHEITSKVKSGQYSSTQEFLDDFKLLAKNANHYNEPSSDIAKNSLIISDFVEDQVKQFNGESTTSSSTDSSKPIKSEQTPKLPKIKLRTPAASAPSTPSTPAGQGSIKKPLLDIIQELIDYEVDGIRIGDPFFEEVSRKDFPDYYQIIKQPMSLNSVKKHISGNRMKSIEQFENETDLIWKNAQTYNEESSLLYQDSKTLENVAHQKIEELRAYRATPASKRKQPLKLKAKPPTKSNLKIHLNMKKEESPDDEEANDDVDMENKDEEKELTETKDDTSKEDNKEGDQNGENSTENGDKKPETVDPLQAIKSTRKRSSKQTAADALIQEISISSSRSIYKQQVKSQSLNQLPSIFQNWFEYRFEANDFQVQSYTLSLPPQQGAVSVLAALNDSLVDRKHQANLTVNGERVNPIPSIQYADSGRRLTSRYELKLAVGLNMVVFDVAVDPVFNEESRLRSQDAAPNVEKLTFWIQVIQ